MNTNETIYTVPTVIDVLWEKANALKARFPGISFGYIGNLDIRWGDDRSWYIFLPPSQRDGYIGIYDRVGGYRTEKLDAMLADWDVMERVAISRWLDRTTAQSSAFRTFRELLDAPGGYFPTIYVDKPERLALADAYDTAQEGRGDKRRAFRHSNF
jgi:hypothetical protein